MKHSANNTDKTCQEFQAGFRDALRGQVNWNLHEQLYFRLREKVIRWVSGDIRKQFDNNYGT